MSDFDKYDGSSCLKIHLEIWWNGSIYRAQTNDPVLSRNFDQAARYIVKKINLHETWEDLPNAFFKQYKFNIDITPSREDLVHSEKKKMSHSRIMPWGEEPWPPKLALSQRRKNYWTCHENSTSCYVNAKCWARLLNHLINSSSWVSLLRWPCMTDGLLSKPSLVRGFPLRRTKSPPQRLMWFMLNWLSSWRFKFLLVNMVEDAGSLVNKLALEDAGSRLKRRECSLMSWCNQILSSILNTIPSRSVTITWDKSVTLLMIAALWSMWCKTLGHKGIYFHSGQSNVQHDPLLNHDGSADAVIK